MHDGPKKGFAFVIDTNSYAGNFEREMTAYITGEIGECGVGENIIQEEFDYTIFQDYIKQVPDDSGCYRPTSIWPIKRYEGFINQTDYFAVAIFFEEMPNDEQVKIMKERAQAFPKVFAINGRMANFYNFDLIQITGFRILEFVCEIKEIKL